MLKVKVDRRRWLVGTDENSYLYRPSDRKMCCLGFVARRLGAKVSEISKKETPAECEGVGWPGALLEAESWAIPHVSTLCLDLMSNNDDCDLSHTEREQRIEQTGKKAGIEFVFVGEYPARS